MFGWLKSLFGSEPSPVIVPPPLPKVKKVVKNVEKPAAKTVAKKTASKTTSVKEKAVKAPRKKKEIVSSVEPVLSVDSPVVETVSVEVKTKKKGGRPKKNNS